MSDRNNQIFCGTGCIQHNFTIHFLCHPSLNPHSVGRIYQCSLTVNTESTGSGIKCFFTVFQYKETVSLNCNVGRNTCCLQISLGKNGVDTGSHNTETYFFGVNTTNFCGRTSCPGNLLGNHVLKIDTTSLETCRVNICNVVTDYIQTCLVVLHSGYTGVK